MKNRHIPFFNYPWVYKEYEAEILETMTNVMNRGAFILQKDLEKFEESLKRFLSVKYVFGVADGTNALILALRASGIGAGDEVILPSHTYIASAASIHFVGASPVPVECGSDHMLDPMAIEASITKKTKAVMPVQLNGRTCQMDAIQEIAERHSLTIIEDAAQALGSRYRGKSAGTFGIAGTFSFYPAKVLGCFGDGGGLVTNDDVMAEKIALLRDHGRNRDGEVIDWGTNCRLDNLQAAILNVKLKHYQETIEKRRQLASLYKEGLSDLEKIHLPPGPDHDPDPDHFDIYQNYEIEAEERDGLRAFLSDNGIGTLVQFGGRAIHQHRELGFDFISLPFTECVYERALMLPMNTSLNNQDIEYICSVIQKYYRNR